MNSVFEKIAEWIRKLQIGSDEGESRSLGLDPASPIMRQAKAKRVVFF